MHLSASNVKTLFLCNSFLVLYGTEEYILSGFEYT